MTLDLVTAGESHGRELVAVLSGVPAGLRLDRAAIDAELARRQHGYGRGGRQKIEKDRVDVRAGLRGGVTLGSPLLLYLAAAGVGRAMSSRRETTTTPSVSTRR